jgi:DNA invertase Pin-like site-specific DNA recombinase
MNLSAYIRVSTTAQALDGYGLDVQKKVCRTWAKANGHRIVAWCEDAGVSGDLDAADRAGLSAALDALRPPPKATGLLVARLDRLARSLTVQEAVLQVAWRAGASVFTADAGEVLPDDPSDPMRTAMRQMAGVFAQLDRALVVKRLRDGREAKAAQGRHAAGDYRFGYRGTGEGKQRDAAPDPEEQATVARIMELRGDGQSYREVALALDSEGLKPRRAASWSAMSVRNIVTRETTDAVDPNAGLS